MAKEKDLAVALTDHNTIKGLLEFTKAAKELGVTAVSGVELATEYNEKEIHLLGLFLEEKHYAKAEALTEEYLRRKILCNRAPQKLDLLEAVSFLKEINALPVLAHPLKELPPTELRKLLPSAITAGLCGIETRHSDYTDEMLTTATETAKEFRLLESGGSDFHGTNKPHISLGTGKGNLHIPIDFYQKLSDKHISQKHM